MAMLAEKRTKTRYYLHNKALNPRGNAWCEDSSKFGQRMLEKMGWSQGKGLGVKENGSTDPVTVSYKWDSKGMGYKGADGDEAVAQQKDFDALLATLSQNSSADGEHAASPKKSPKSLELMSQKSRARVHYHKFTRGKDLSRASSKDLASILGMATEIKSSVPSSTEPIVKPDVGPPIEQNMVTTFGITTIARGNINEYFKQKYEERKRKMASSECDAEEKSQSLDETATVPVTTCKPSDYDCQPEKVSKKKKKKKAKKEEEENEIDGNSAVMDDTLQDNDTSTSKSRRKSVTWGDVEVSFVSKYIKDMVDTSSDSINGDSDTNVSVDTDEDPFSTNSKKKKKKKDKKRRKELTIELIEQNSEDKEVIEEATKTSKKRGRKSKEISDTGEGTLGESSNTIGAEELSDLNGSPKYGTETTPIKKKKKKSSIELEQIGSFEDSAESDTNESSSKKQKKKKMKDLSEGVFSESNDGQCEESHVSSKKKKKKMKSTICCESGISDEFEERSRKRKKSESQETLSDSVVDDKPVLEEFSETKKKKKRKREAFEMDSCQEIKLDALGNDISVVASSCIDDDETMKKKKRKKHLNGDPDNVSDSNGQPALSELTQERMAKWKERRKNKDTKNITEECVPEGNVAKSKTAKLEYNPNQPTQDYNHRKVLSTLGYNVKGAIDKIITVKMPETNFSGSNLDSIPGYGHTTIKSC